MYEWVQDFIETDDTSTMTGIPTKAAIVAGSAATTYLMFDYFGGGQCKSEASLKGKTVVITGCNTGIGKETAKDLCQRGAKVVMACRNLELAEQAANEIKQSSKDGEIIVKQLDLANLDSVRAFAQEVIFLA